MTTAQRDVDLFTAARDRHAVPRRRSTRKVKVDVGVLMTLRDAARCALDLHAGDSAVDDGWAVTLPPDHAIRLSLEATDRHVPAAPAPARARRGDPSTSAEAAASISEEAITHRERQVLTALVEYRTVGRTSTELAMILREPDGELTPRDSITPRIRPLVERGLVFASEDRRPGPSGRANTVWKIMPAGCDVLKGMTDV